MKKGWIEVICGPMFSGKTEELLRRIRRVKIAGKSLMLYKSEIDTRYNPEKIVSHVGTDIQARVLHTDEFVIKHHDLFSDFDKFHKKPVDVVAIDEVQFFTHSVVDAIVDLADNGTRVIVTALDRDFRGLPFSYIPEILARADRVDKLTAICVNCGEPATMTQRLIDGYPAHWDGETVVVGTDDKYEARCRDCHEVDLTDIKPDPTYFPTPTPGTYYGHPCGKKFQYCGITSSWVEVYNPEKT